MPEFRIDPDYREVPERIAEWYERFPEGRIICKIIEETDDRVTMQAAAFRSQDPGVPPSGVGHSTLAKPGKTPYTRDSEIENAETSAAGRALVMAGIPAKNVASAGEIRSKTSTEPPSISVDQEAASVNTPHAASETSAVPAADPSGGEGLDMGKVEDPNPPTTRVAGPNDWATAARALKTTRPLAQAQVMAFFKTAQTDIRSLEQVNIDDLTWALSSIQIAKRTQEAKP